MAAGSAAAIAVGVGPAAAADSAAGTYVALTRPSRIVDARLGAGHRIQPRLAGLGGLPAHDIGAVVGTLTAYSPTADGRLVAYPRHRPATASLYFTKGKTASNTVVAALNRGRLNFADVARSGHVRVAFDVTGYYRAGSSSTPGAFHAVAPARVVDGRKLGHGHAFTAVIAGRGGVPRQSVGAVAVTIHVLDPTASGTLIAGSPDVPDTSRPALHYRAGEATSAFAVLSLGTGTGVRIADPAKSGTVRVSVDVAGYYTYGTAARGGAYEPLAAPAHFSHTTLAGGANRSVQAAGRGGVAHTDVTAAVVVLHASGSDGALQVHRPGARTPHTPVALTVSAAHTRSNVLIVPLSRRGAFDVHSTARKRLQLDIDVVGYVPATTISAPAPFVGRYVRNLSSSDDTANMASMQAEGEQDAAAGSNLVLLDIGAELNDRTGVLLSATNRKLTWAHLVTALDAYLAGYASASGTVAIATNNDGDWQAYPAKARGRDWANKVIDALTVPAGVDVAGAADIEAGFASTRAQAQTWEDAYLAATSQLLYFVGSADGCPITFGATEQTCRFGWTEDQYYSLACDSTQLRVLPQVYTPDEAVQWANINATGGHRCTFAGALTERAAAPGLSQHPAQGWAALYRALSAFTDAPDVPAVVDLQSDD